jgi:hypothetical protein
VVFRRISSHPCHRDLRVVWLKRQYLSKSQKAVLEAFHTIQGSLSMGAL